MLPLFRLRLAAPACRLPACSPLAGARRPRRPPTCASSASARSTPTTCRSCRCCRTARASSGSAPTAAACTATTATRRSSTPTTRATRAACRTTASRRCSKTSRAGSGPAPRTAWRASTRKPATSPRWPRRPGPSSQRIVKAIIGDGARRHVGGHLGRPAACRQRQRRGACATPTTQADPASLASNDVNALALDAGRRPVGQHLAGRARLPGAGRQAVRPPPGRLGRRAPTTSSTSCARCITAPTARCGSAPRPASSPGTRAQPWSARQRIDSPPMRINCAVRRQPRRGVGRHPRRRPAALGQGQRQGGALRAPRQRSAQPAVGPHPRRDAGPRRHAVGRLVHRRHQPGQPEQPGLRALHPVRRRHRQHLAEQLGAEHRRRARRAASGWATTPAFRCSTRPTAPCSRPTAASRSAPARLSNDIVYSLYQQPDGPLWVGTSAGLNRLDQPDGAVQEHPVRRRRQQFHQHHRARRRRHAVARHRPAGDPLRHRQRQVDRLSGRPGRSRPAAASTAPPRIVEDKRGRVWMGSDWSGGGLDLLDPASGKFRHFRHDPADPASLADDNVSSPVRGSAGPHLGRHRQGPQPGADRRPTAPSASAATPARTASARSRSWRCAATAPACCGCRTAGGLLRLDPASGAVSRFQHLRRPVGGLRDRRRATPRRTACCISAASRA